MQILPIRWKITILSFSIVLFSLTIAGIILSGNYIKTKEDEYGIRAMMTARTVAQLPDVIQNIERPEGWKTVNPIVEQIRVINNIDYITVLNMDRIRYAHPVNGMLGTVSNGADEAAAFASHIYTSKAKGELGTAVRAFFPILNENNEQIGVVIAGNILPTVTEAILGLGKMFTVTVFLALLFGIFGSWMLAKHIKQQTFQLEPHEIVRMLVERNATFQSMHEGVIAIDNNEIITIFNDRAKQMLAVKGDVIGKKITEVIPDSLLPEIMYKGEAVFNQDVQVNDALLVSNRVPIKVNDETVGAVAFFQDRTEVGKMAEELTGVRAFVDALRVQNHEHLNKLHTIAGLIQLGDHKQALSYVFKVFEEQDQLTKFLNENIENNSISGLLLSKVSRGKELGINVEIDRRSQLMNLPEQLDHHNFVLILGNLVENAFQALERVEREKKEIYISIEQDDDICSILVEDNGCGIANENIEKIFEKNFSTKDEQGSGIGLNLVKQIIEKGNGVIEITSTVDVGTSFIITFPMKIEEAVQVVGN
ncbi:ATP-binding protein [Salirhabdus salicampi]|uniref:ATP-binding protein n=1 Tax=Salirhabdus salicampi TaxID=476102 RepID=UPI00266CD9C8|nr:sensor histidine kinase [Salirhabdus salicampi]